MMARTHIWSLVAINIVALALGFAFYPQLPNPAPIHWNINGQVDGYGPPWVDAFLMPAIGIGLSALLIALPYLGPLRGNLERSRIIYGRIAVAVLFVFLVLHVIILLTACGQPIAIGRAIPFALGLLFAALGNWFGKLRRNMYVGIRTPWTIANEQVWERTHRLGGRLFFAFGAMVAACAFFLPDWANFVLLIGGAIGTSAWTIVYSAVLYRRLGSHDDMHPATNTPEGI